MSFLKVSYENMLENEVVVAYFVEVDEVFRFMEYLLDKYNSTVFVEKVDEI